MEKLTTSYWPADTSEQMTQDTVGDVLWKAYQAAPKQLALVEGTATVAWRRTWTYESLWNTAEQCAHALLQHFQPRDRIAVWANNIPEWVMLEFGAALANITLVTVNPAYQARELQYVLQQSRVVGLFLVEEFHGNDLRNILDSVRSTLPDLQTVVSFADWQEFCASSGSNGSLPPVRPDDIAQIQYTSGTTGVPKGAMLRHSGLVNNARFVATRGGATDHNIWLSAIPLFHSSGSGLGVLGAVQTLGTQVLVPQFIPATVLELLETYRVDVAPMVPTMIQAVWSHPDRSHRNLESLRYVWSGGAQVPPEVVRLVEETGNARFSTVFGQTEASPIITQTSPDDSAEDKAWTVGRPLPHAEVKIVNPNTGAIVPVREPGELCVRGYLVMAGYFDRPDATQTAIDRDGWLHTGDLCTMDSRGYVRVEGRITDLIIRGGENIYPKEVEDVLATHSAVMEVAVVGIPDAYWGEQAAAFVQLASGSTVTIEELRAFAATRLAHYKVPRYWQLTDQFPRTPLGKIQKFRLREQFHNITPDGPDV